MKQLELIQKVLKVKLKECQSSNILAYGWDAKKRSLIVVFKNYATYAYLHRSKEEFDELDQAKSKGTWVNANLVKPKAEFKRYVFSGIK